LGFRKNAVRKFPLKQAIVDIMVPSISVAKSKTIWLSADSKKMITNHLVFFSMLYPSFGIPSLNQRRDNRFNGFQGLLIHHREIVLVIPVGPGDIQFVEDSNDVFIIGMPHIG